VTNRPLSGTCDVVACPHAANGRYLHLRQGRALQFNVCATHFDRIESGETPEVVDPQQLDVAKADARPALVMDPF
jgi:hypothetical protein